jgi:Flp pilus assembly protein TadG
VPSETNQAQVRQTRTAANARPRRRSRGQALVEFGLVAPLFFALIFGIIEYSLINFSISTMNFAAKDAARIGSLLGSTDPTTDCRIVADIRGRTAGVVTAKVTKIEVFKAAIDGSVANLALVNVYSINSDTNGDCTSSTLPWPPSAREQGLFDADYLGVRVTYAYTYLTGFIAGAGTTLTLTALSVQRIEPQDFGYRHQHGSIVRASGDTVAPAPGIVLAARRSGGMWSHQAEWGGALCICWVS